MSTPRLIQHDTVWTDPYYDLRQAGVVVFPNVTLTIRGTAESPVVIAFGDEKTAIHLQSQAHLVGSNVRFEGNDQKKRTSLGIKFLGDDNTDTTAQISNLFCTHMATCIVSQGMGNSVDISDSVFVNNTVAVSGLIAPINLRDSVFVGHDASVVLSGGSINALNCTFLDSKEVFLDLGKTNSAVVQGCLFYGKNCLTAINYDSREGATCGISNNVFAYNDVAIKATDYTSDKTTKVSSSTFIENRFGIVGGPIGISDSIFFRSQVAAIGQNYRGNIDSDYIGTIDGVTFQDNNVSIHGYVRSITRSNLLNSTTYHLQNGDYRYYSKSWNATNLYWGTQDMNSIRPKIYDVYQDPTMGLITIEPLAEHPFPGWNWTPPESFFGSSADDGPFLFRVRLGGADTATTPLGGRKGCPFADGGRSGRSSSSFPGSGAGDPLQNPFCCYPCRIFFLCTSW